jgi:clan AA aspartic protease
MILSWSFTDESLMVPVRITNPFLDAHYPPDGMVMAVLDTGFTGFLLIPFETFRALKLNELKPRLAKGELANGTSIELQAAYGILEIPEVRFEDEGLIESNPHIKEILLGVRGMKKLRTVIDGCRRIITTSKC